MIRLSNVAARLRDKDVNIIIVAAATGLHTQTLYKVMQGKNVSYETFEKLSDYFEAKDSAKKK